MAQIGYYTEEGLRKMKDELQQLKTIERKAATQAIVDARDKGDLSENAEYDAAREAQALLELRIAKLEDVIANARIVDETQLDLSKVSILTTVKIKNTTNGAIMKYTFICTLIFFCISVILFLSISLKPIFASKYKYSVLLYSVSYYYYYW